MSTKANFSTGDFNLQACCQLTETAPLGEDLYALKWALLLELVSEVFLSPSKEEGPRRGSTSPAHQCFVNFPLCHTASV